MNVTASNATATTVLPSYAMTAIMYSAFTSSGFILSVLVGWLLVRIFSRSTRIPPSSSSSSDVRDIGSYGKFMVVMEAIDAVPEALVIAASTADGTMTYSLAASIFALNIVNTLSTSLDFLAVSAEPVFPRLMLALVSFSVGSMAFSISSIMFEGFVVRVVSVPCRACYVAAFFGGIVVGVMLVWTLTLVEARLRRKFGVRDIPAKSFNSDHLMRFVYEKMQREKEVVARLQQQQQQQQGGKPNPDIERNIQFYAERIMPMQKMMDTSQQATELSENTALYVADDANSVIHDALAQQWHQEFSDNVFQNGGGRRVSVVGGLSSSSDRETVVMDDGAERDEEDLSHAHRFQRSDSVASLIGRSRRGKRCCRCGPLGNRGIKLLLIMLCIFTWTVGLTFAFTPLFALLDSHSTSQYLETFADGMSGGAFLALIGSTMIPRMQQDAYRTMWTATTTKSVGMFGFVGGVVATFSIDLVRALVG
jgi:hypothetical protein